MAYKLIWSPASRDDLRDIVAFISRDSVQRAQTFGYRLISEVDKLQNFSQIGRVVPEYDLPTLREIIVRYYRVVYRVDHERKLIEIARVWHAARGTPNYEVRGKNEAIKPYVPPRRRLIVPARWVRLVWQRAFENLPTACARDRRRWRRR
jgi:toxin ParE1/3/4